MISSTTADDCKPLHVGRSAPKARLGQAVVLPFMGKGIEALFAEPAIPVCP